jgi:hypothetical protein
MNLYGFDPKQVNNITLLQYFLRMFELVLASPIRAAG